jgi:predicted nucleic acid-binding protein
LRRFLYDTAIFSYALGGKHLYRKPCRRIVQLATAGELRGEASADLIQELANQRLRRTGDRGHAAATARNVTKLVRLHPLEPDDALLGIDLFETNPRLNARDAIFAAVALNHGIDLILATDRAFDDVGGLKRIDPADEHAVATLLS